MTNRRHQFGLGKRAAAGVCLRAILLLLLLLLPVSLLAGCSAAGAVSARSADGADHTENASAIGPAGAVELSGSDLQQALDNEFERLGIDPREVSAEAPGIGNEVFDLALEPVYDEDGATVLAIRLRWTERLLGDYDGNGRVSAADLTPIGLNFRRAVSYDPAEEHGGIAWWPAGNPDDAGGAELNEASAAASGARNWAIARIDGDANGQISVADLTPLALNWQARLDSYRIYRRGPGEDNFTLLPNPGQPEERFTVSRASAAAAQPLYPDSSRPLRYVFEDPVDSEGQYEYLVAPYDSLSDTEGPKSLTPGGSQNVQARFEADRIGGTPPLLVAFDASTSTVSEGQISSYQWDFNNDGEIDSISVTPDASELFEQIGAYVVVLRVVSSQGDIGLASKLITVGETPELQLSADPPGGEVPLTIHLSAQASSQTGVISKYEWDLDGDGSFELSTGPVPEYSLSFSQPGARAIAVRVTDQVGISAVDAIELELKDDFDEIEPNDGPLQGSQLGSLGVGNGLSPASGSLGQLSYDGDSTDWFRLQLQQAGILTLNLDCANDGDDVDLALYNADGSKLLGLSQIGGGDISFSLGVRSAGTCMVKLTRPIGSGSDDARYTLAASLAALVYDETENNDSAAQADDLGQFSGALLPGYWGSLGAGGPDGDSEDWYKLSLATPASFNVLLSFAHLDADLELQFFDSDKLTVLAESRTVQDDEMVHLDLAAGQYYIRCFRYNGSGANYTLGFSVE